MISIFLLNVVQGQIIEIRTYYDQEEKQPKETVAFDEKLQIPQGKYLLYFQNGQIKIQGNYKDGQPDGAWEYFYETGIKKSEGTFQKGEQTGVWSYYFESGKIRAQGNLVNGKKSGFWSNFYENGEEKSNGGYFNDKKEGIWNHFFEDGSIKAQAYYEGGDGKYQQFYPSGNIRMEGLNRNGKSEGLWTYYHKSGEILSRGQFSNGLRVGHWRYFHDNGKISAEGDYEKGKRTGKWVFYHPTGKISAQGELKNNQRDGQWSLYYESGDLKAQSTYDEGDGVYTEYYASGKQKAKGQMLNGKRHGKWIYFNEEGVLDGEAEYDSGLGKYTGFYEDQTIKMTGGLDGDRRVGDWQLYNPDGSLAGVYRPIYEEEKPIFKITEPITPERGPSDKPEYIYKSKQIQYFDKTINEYQGIIIASNPLWTAFNELPLSVEYYFQERLGYEVLAIYHREPFYQPVDELSLNETYVRGVSVRFRQKFYHPEGNLGMFYFGHQLGVTLNNHKAKAQDQTSLPFERLVITSNEILGYYGLFVGLRWIKNRRKSGFGQYPGFTIDAFVGADIGFRNWERLYDETNEDFNEVFQSLNQSGLYVPIRFGVNLGFAIRRKTKSK